jgi:regulator of sirC expression with transglutaminase-like and TPR domain
MALPAFSTLASAPDPRLDELALAIAAEFGEVDDAHALEQLDAFGTEIAAALSDSPRAPHREAAATRLVLADRCGFTGDRREYGTPVNSMLDKVIDRRRGLPITLSIVYVEAGRRAGVELAGVGLPGHFVVGHFRPAPPLLLDPFNGGSVISDDHPPQLVRPWTPHEIATRMLNNLVVSYSERGDLSRALHASDMRLELPADDATRAHQMLERTRLLAMLN